jgi:DNA-binding response OmpR family regulator
MEKPVVVVVVDDEEPITRLVRRSLERLGCEIHTVFEGKSGIETVMEVKPDLVLLDVRLPIVQGYEVCRFLKGHADTRDVKILMMSGLMSPSDQDWAKRCGADDTMQKPFDRDELVQKVTGLVTTKGG